MAQHTSLSDGSRQDTVQAKPRAKGNHGRQHKSKSRRWAMRLGVLGLVSAMLAMSAANRSVVAASQGRLHDDVATVPKCHAALVFGCSPLTDDGLENRFFTRRMDAAALLYLSGKVEWLIVSGDNHKIGYNEPAQMQQALIERGVPQERIQCDYAGFRTLDSVVRAQKVFGQNELVVVSQPSHNQRAIYIGQAHGMVLHGFNARDVVGVAAKTQAARESLARVKAVVDVNVLKKQPKFLGPPIVLAAQGHGPVVPANAASAGRGVGP